MQNKLSVSHQLGDNKIVPVVVVQNESQALGLCDALLEGGVSVIEVTLRNSFGLSAIELIAKQRPEMLALAGTVNSAADYRNVVDAGVQGVISPGLTTSLLEEANRHAIPYLPGVASASDILLGMEYGLTEFKLFPAGVVGGVGALKALSGPFPSIKFCPTGGVSKANFTDYLAVKNVMCVGGSWIAPSKQIEQKDWQQITSECKEAIVQLGD